MLLFARLDVLGVAWLRVASAAAVFAVWRRPWRMVGRLNPGERWTLLALGAVLAVMNSVFYLAVDRLPLSTVGAIGFLFAFANCALFMLYIMVGHRIANTEGGIDRLGAAMLIAAVTATPWGLGGALPAFGHPVLLAAGAGVGVCSSVIPYITDQLAMARLPRATFSLMMALLPTFATVIGAIILRQVPTLQDVVGITLVVLGVALHQDKQNNERN